MFLVAAKDEGETRVFAASFAVLWGDANAA